MQIEQLYQLYLQYPSVQTDTRKLKAGDLFFALKGDHFNGNLFAKQALEKGAAAVIVDEDPGFTDERIHKTDDVLTTLQHLALHHRKQFNIPFLAITGSNGKTTTKELIHAVLSTRYKTYTTEGNLNNHIGIPLTLLKIGQDAEIAVVEMGANHQKEIEGYCQYTLPTHGIINNCGKAHLEGFGGIEGVRKGKGELFDFIRQHNGTIFINADYEYLQTMSHGISHQITYGTQQAETTGVVVEHDPFLKVVVTSATVNGTIQTQLVGDYNLPNLLAAVAVGAYFKVPEAKIIHALEHYKPSNSRSQMVLKDGNHIILDAYNANPSSMKLAIENFAKVQASKKILMLGSMAELGTESETEHRAIVELIRHFTWDHVVLVGPEFERLGHEFLSFRNAEEARQWYLEQHFSSAHLLVKGSRSMKMERIIESA